MELLGDIIVTKVFFLYNSVDIKKETQIKQLQHETVITSPKVVKEGKVMDYIAI